MTEHSRQPGCGQVVIGDLTVDLDRHEVWRSKQKLDIPRLSFKLLAALIRASPGILQLDELVEQVWDGRPVTNETLHQRVRLLRRALDDDAADPAYIGLVRGEGYRLLLDVRPMQPSITAEDHCSSRSNGAMSTFVPFGRSAENADDAGLGNQPGSRGHRRAVAILAMLLAAGLAGWWIVASVRPYPAVAPGAPSAVVDKSVAVLPFTDLSPQGDQKFFGDGITEELLDELTRLEGLRVASRTSSLRYKNSGGDIRSVGQALNVGNVLTGSVRKSGDQVRVTAQLTDARSGFHLWSQTFERELTDIFAIQDEIAEAVAGTLGVTLDVGDVNAFSGAGTTNVEAYQVYLEATQRYLPLDSTERIRLLERAVEQDPDYAAAWASLGLTIASTMWISPVEEAPELLARAIPIVHRAVQLDPDSSFAYNMLATVNYATMDWIRSEEYFARAFETRPDGETFANYANLMMRSGRSARSLRYQGFAAMAERNPADSHINFNAALALGHMESVERRPTRFGGISPAVSGVLVALNSNDPVKLGQVLEDVSPSDVGVYELAQAVLRNVDSPPAVLSAIKAIYQDTGVQWPAKHHDCALFAAFFGDAEFALEAISHEARLTTIRYGALWYPVMSEVRKLPGFKRLVTETNLAEYWRAYGWPEHCRPIGDDDLECF